jgi:hypothetical protein
MNCCVKSIICIVLIALIGVMLGACASMSLPPERPVTDLKAIAGRWQGFTVVGGNRFDLTSTIREDGTYENIIPALSNPGPRFTGRVRVEGGQFRWRSDTTGRTGTWTLREGDGQRVIVSRADDGGYSEYRPVK